MADMIYTCHGCKERLSVKDLRYDFEGKHLLCSGCREVSERRRKGEKGQPATRMPVQAKPEAKFAKARPVDKMATAERVIGPVQTVRYRCDACNYAFTRYTKIENICPYCAKKGHLYEDRSNNALKDIIDVI